MRKALTRIERLERHVKPGECRCDSGVWRVLYPLPDGSYDPNASPLCVKCGGQVNVIWIRYADASGQVVPLDMATAEQLITPDGLTREYPAGF